MRRTTHLFRWFALCVVLLLSIVLIIAPAVAPIVVHAQDEPQPYCNLLSADDCALIDASLEAMSALESVTTDVAVEFEASNIPDAPFDTIDFEIEQKASVALSPQAVKARDDMRELLNSDPELLREDPQTFMILYVTYLLGTNVDMTQQLRVSEDVIRLIEDAYEEDEGEPFPFELPSSLTFSTRLVDGSIYLNISELADAMPGLIALGDIWLGVEFGSMADLVLGAVLEDDAGLEMMDAEEAEQFRLIMNSALASSGGPLAATLAKSPLTAQAAPFLIVERIDNDGDNEVETAQFQTTIDYDAMLADPTMQQLLAELIRDPDFGDQDFDDAEMDEILTLAQAFGPQLLATLGLQMVEEIDVETGMMLNSQLSFNWDIAELAPLIGMAGGPDLSELDQLPIFALDANTSYADHNADVVIEDPETALILSTEELIDIIPADELEQMFALDETPPVQMTTPEAPTAEAPTVAVPLSAGLTDDVDVLIAEGQEQADLGEYDEAIRRFDAAIELDPNNGLAYSSRASAHSDIGEYELSVADYGAAIAIDPENAELYFDRALVYYSMDDLESEIADYGSVIELAPNYTLAYYYRGLSYVDLGELELALIDYSSALSLDPEDSDIYFERGFLYFDLDENELARDDFSKVIELDPGYATAYVNRSHAYYQLEEYELSLADATTATELDPESVIGWGNRADANGKLGNYGEAFTEYDEALKLDPEYALAYRERGLLYQTVGQTDEAIADLEYYLELEPEADDRQKVEDALAELDGATPSAAQDDASEDDSSGESSSLKLYESQEGAFSFYYPADWGIMDGGEGSNDPDVLAFSDDSLFDDGPGAALAVQHFIEGMAQDPETLFEEFLETVNPGSDAALGTMETIEAGGYTQVIQSYDEEDDGRELSVVATVVVYEDRWYGIAWAITADEVASEGAALDAVVYSLNLGGPSPFAGQAPEGDPVETPEQPEPEDAAWKTFTSDDLTFAMRYPAEWQIDTFADSSDTLSIEMISPTEDGEPQEGESFVAFFGEVKARQLSTLALRRTHSEWLEEIGLEGELASEQIDELADGQVTQLRQEYTSVEDELDLAVTTITLVSDAQYAHFIIGVLQPDPEEFQTLVDELLTSINILGE